jgi:hypothetical protein
MRENKIGWFATSPTLRGQKPKHKWDDLKTTPYLNNDDIAQYLPDDLREGF